MKLLETLIRRPVVSMVLNLLLVCLGTFAFINLPVRQYPNIVQPQITITTTYEGANPKLMEELITTPIEDQLVGVEGLRYYSSTTVASTSTITLTFDLDADFDGATSEVFSRVNAAQDNFPADAEPPVILRAAASQPIMYIQLDSEERSIPELMEYFELAIKPLYEQVPGIQDLDAYGTEFGMRLWLDPEKLAARGLVPLDVVQAVENQNLDLPGGTLENQTKEYEVRTLAELNTPSDFNEMIVAYRNGYPIRFKDVGRAELAEAEIPPSWGFWDGSKPTFAFGVTIFPDANALEVAEKCIALIDVVRADLPGDMWFGLNYDRTQFIDDSISEVRWTLAEAIGLVVLVVSLFLLSARATFIPVITIPLSLFGAIGAMYVMGFSINTMTLLALVLAIGLVVDDAIVVVENTYRHVEAGMSPMTSAITGIREIAPAICATTLVLATVYVPIGFTAGQTGLLFREFAFTLAGAVLVSGFIALTLSPMMCSRFLRPRKRRGTARHAAAAESGGQPPSEIDLEVPDTAHEPWLQRVYAPILTFVLKRLRPVVLLMAVAVGFGAWAIYRQMPQELIPTEDENLVFVVLKAPDGTNFYYIEDYAKRCGEIVENNVPEAQLVLNLVGFPNQGLAMSGILLKPVDERKRSAEEIARSLEPHLAPLTGVIAIPMVPPPSVLASTSNQHVNFVMTTVEGDYETLGAAVEKLLTDPETSKYITGVESDLTLGVMNFDTQVERDAAAAAGLTADDIATNLAASLAPYRITKIRRKGRTYDVYVQMPLDERPNPSTLDRLYIRNAMTDALVPMSSVASMVPRIGPISLNHYESQRSVTLNANVAEGSSLGAALQYLQDFAEKTPNVDGKFTGYSDTFMSSRGQFGYLFGAALIVVYLVLSAMFNSFIDPFIVLLTVPLAMFGGLLALWLSGGTMNLYSNIGLITLVGLISKHGILIVDFANQFRREGKDVRTAIIDATRLRVRPILMTTGAMVLGALPLAITHGPGWESRHPLGWVIVGGLLFGTTLTLLVIPTVYSYLAHLESPVRGGEEDTPID